MVKYEFGCQTCFKVIANLNIWYFPIHRPGHSLAVLARTI